VKYVTAQTKTHVGKHEIVCKAHSSIAARHMDEKLRHNPCFYCTDRNTYWQNK